MLDDLNEYLASTDDSNDEHGDIDKLRALLYSNNDSDINRSEDDKDMEITFNTGLEDLSKRILEKKDKKMETAWDKVLRRQSEKRKARKNSPKYLSDDDTNIYDVKGAAEQMDDFFAEETTDAFNQTGMQKNKGSEHRIKLDGEIEEKEASRVELELLFVDDQGTDKCPKGYNMKSKNNKGKKKQEIVAEEMLPNVDCSNDPRFAALFTNHLYALDPTDPNYKRSVAFARKKLQKQIGSNEKDITEAERFEKPVAGLENEKHELSSIVRSLKRNIGNIKKFI